MRRLPWIVACVVAVHAVLFWLLADRKVLPHKPYVAPDDFSGREKVLTDAKTGETLRYREFTVSTTFALPAAPEAQTR